MSVPLILPTSKIDPLKRFVADSSQMTWTRLNRGGLKSLLGPNRLQHSNIQDAYNFMVLKTDG